MSRLILKNEACTAELDFSIPEKLYILSFFTDENKRGQGYGTSLLKEVIQLARKRGIRYIFLDDVCGTIYRKFNFQIQGFTKRGRLVWIPWKLDSVIIGPERRLVIN